MLAGKRVLFIIVCCSSIIGCASMADSAVRMEIGFDEQTIEFIDSFVLDKNKIYDNTIIWLSKIYNSSKNVIEIQNRDSGIIVVKAIISVAVSLSSFPCSYSMEIRIKDGKTKMTFTILKMQTEWGGYPPKNSMENIYLEFSSIHNLFIDYFAKEKSSDEF